MYYLPIFKIAVVIILVFALAMRRFMFKVVLSTHTAYLPTNLPRRFHIILTLQRECRCLFTTHRQLITIRYPIRKQLPEKTVNVLAMRRMNLWNSERTSEGIHLCEPVPFRGIDSTGHWTFSALESPFVGWDDLVWESERPFAFKRSGYGDAVVDIRPDPTPLENSRPPPPL